ncbi:oxygen-independent coproporphyrinogen-3 oxidase [Bradyrhizobium sp. Ghvi]|uniref:coproporphyrinogen-III oxidase family protein n=1 Tax=Bradyrhizobium sp. Ghvi TaxID=1855319 RepID=UPI0008E60E47|nr:coproporphyrinogen-III oxidase family protein [Bradyrhizobium sp. Ghvi]SFP56771.1 oxygen-independent coproporphyrinogen-3 oxidase [Bradyrhizobium sp. Ghvi]
MTYDQLFPVTHHFYPLQHCSDPELSPFSDFVRGLGQRKRKPTDNLIYLHIPYCEKRCIFCPFHVRVKRDETIFERYVRALEREIEMLARLPYVDDMRFKAVYFGGGSPSMLSTALVRRLYDALRSHFDIDQDAEWTFEGEPHSLSDPELLSYLAEQGTTRLSFGVQTFDRKLRETLNIAATVEDVIDCTEVARAAGIGEINIDMMFFLPGQTPADLDDDIAELARHDFDSIDYYYMSYYGLPQKAFQDMETGLFPKRPPEGARFSMNRQVRERMSVAGYHHVTDHVFSRSQKGSEYYRLLWGGGFGRHDAETLGIGASSRGYINGYSYANNVAHDAYMAEVEAGKLPVFKVSDRLRDERNRGLVFFPKFFSIDESMVPDDGRTMTVLQKLIDGGLARRQNHTIAITEDGKDWIPNITVDLFEREQRTINDKWVQQLASRFSNRVTL